MEGFVLRMPVKIIFGVGEISKAGEEAAKIGKKALLVTGRSHVVKSGLFDKVMNLLKSNDIDYVHFEGIEPNPRSTTIDRASEIARAESCDFVLGIGGGSVMDASKAIAVASLSGYPIWDYVYNEDPAKVRTIENALPIMLIPTLAATASEGNCGGVITNWEKHQKAVIFSDQMYPRTSIVDPRLTIDVDRQTTINGAMDIMSHVLETYLTGPANTPLQDRFSEGIIRTVMENLEVLLNDMENIEARTNLSWCSTMALLGPVNLGRPGSFPLHFIEHVLSAHYDIAHGRGLAILLPALMNYTYKDRSEKYASLAKNVFFINIDNMIMEQAAMTFIDDFEEWMKSVDMYCVLSEEGISSDKFNRMAKDTIDIYGNGKDFIECNRPLYKDDIVKILELAMG